MRDYDDEARSEVLKDIIADMMHAEGDEMGESAKHKDDGPGGESFKEWAQEEAAEPEHKAMGGTCGHYAHGGEADVHHPECVDHPHSMPNGMHRAHGGMTEEHKASNCEDMKAYAEGGEAPKGKLGSGERFEHLERSLAQKPGVTDPGALAATIGRKSLGKEKFQKIAAKGKR